MNWLECFVEGITNGEAVEDSMGETEVFVLV